MVIKALRISKLNKLLEAQKDKVYYKVRMKYNKNGEKIITKHSPVALTDFLDILQNLPRDTSIANFKVYKNMNILVRCLTKNKISIIVAFMHAKNFDNKNDLEFKLKTKLLEQSDLLLEGSVVMEVK